MKLLDAIKVVSDIENPVDAINTLLDKGCPKSILKIVIADCYDHVTNKDIEATVKAWESANKTQRGSGATGFAAMFYDWLAEGERSEQEAADLILGSESANVRNHLTHYLNIWALAETVRSGRKVYRTIQKSGHKAAKNEGEPKSAKKEKKEAPKDDWTYDDSHPFESVRSAYEAAKREQKRMKPRKTRLHPDKVAHLADEKLTAHYTQLFQTYFGK